jgi:hypothetical protein
VIGLKSRQLYPWLDWFGDKGVLRVRDVTKCGIVGVHKVRPELTSRFLVSMRRPVSLWHWCSDRGLVVRVLA